MISLPFKVLLTFGLIYQSGSFSPILPSQKLKKLGIPQKPTFIRPIFQPAVVPSLKNQVIHEILDFDRDSINKLPIFHRELLFEVACELRGSLAEICEETVDILAQDHCLRDHSIKVTTKGIDQDELHKKIIRKLDLRNFVTPKELSDIVRARINLSNYEQMSNAVQVANLVAIKHGFKVTKMQLPKRQLEPMKFGYPRFHLHLKHPDWPITCEIQIGTTAFEDLIDVMQVPVSDPNILDELKRLKFEANLHDIDYKIFRFLLKKHQESHIYSVLLENLSQPIQKFCDDLDVFASNLGNHGYKINNFKQQSALILARAHELLKLLHARGILAYI